MLVHLAFVGNLVAAVRGWRQHRSPPLPPLPHRSPCALIRGARPTLSQLAQPSAQLPDFVRTCPVAQRYLALLGPLTWERFPERDPHQPWPGPTPCPRAAFVAAFLIKLDQGHRYMPQLRRYLVEHPALVWLLGFPLVPSAHTAWGFDADASLPTHRHFSRVLRALDNAALQFLLDATVQIIGQALPPEVRASFGDVVAGDTKHILAWVRENNPKLYIADRYDKTRQPKGDPDCKLGCKKRHNVTVAEDHGVAAAPVVTADLPSSTPTKDATPASHVEVGEFYWGYASGVIATKLPDWGEFVLAELTQTFDKGDATYFFPLMRQVERRLGHRPRYGAFDMAFDAHYVYDFFHEAGGFAAIPLAARGDTTRTFDPAGLPHCPAGLAMPLKGTFLCRTTAVEHRRGRYVCPLCWPKRPAASTPEDTAAQPTCPTHDPHFAQGGCVMTMSISPGARLRYQLDRDSAAFKTIYKQRTADERINSLALELGIERPKLRNRQAITNQNTLIYVLLNLRAFQRIQAKQALGAQHAASPNDHLEVCRVPS
jgi:hypothetical protein